MRWMLGLGLLAACGGGATEGDATDTAGSADSAASADTDTGTAVAAPAGVVLVVDNSDSMAEAAMALAVGLDQVVAALPADASVAVTTTDVEASAGGFVDTPTRDVEALQAQILCSATCFRSDLQLPTDSDHSCGDPLGDEVTEEWLDCTCGAGAWVESGCGAAIEAGLEAVWLATCRADSAAPASCFDNGLLDASAGGSVDLGASLHAVVISDEGDGSRRLDREPEATVYTDLLASAGVDVAVSVLVPGLDALDEVACPGVGTDWGVRRYVDAATVTGGGVADIYDSDCEPADVVDAVVGLLGG